MRATIKSIDHNRCELTQDVNVLVGDQFKVMRGVYEYWAPSQGGYVYNVTLNPGTSGVQMCDGLSTMGNTLRWSGKVPLVNLIRAEYRAAQRQSRKDQ
jgi:hypothetical protein